MYPITMYLQKQVLGLRDQFAVPTLKPYYSKFSKDHHHQHHLGACGKCRISGPIPELLS